MGGLRGQKCKSLENLPNGWTDWHQIWYTSADSSQNGHRLKTISPSIHQGAFRGGGLGVKNSKVWKIKRLDRLTPNLVHVCRFIWEWTSRLKTNSPSSPGVILAFRWSKCNQKFRNAMICREKMKINYIKIKCTNRHNYAATIPGEAG